MRFRFQPSILKFLDIQSHEVRSKIIDDVVSLGSGVISETRPFLGAPIVFHLYEDDFHWIIYRFELDSMAIANAGDARERPHLWRPGITI